MQLMQKQSPYLDDLNFLIDMSFVMGLSWQRKYNDFLPLGKKCLAWQDVKASHKTGDNHVVINLDQTNGILIILLTGLIGAIMVTAIECLVHKQWFKRPREAYVR